MSEALYLEDPLELESFVIEHTDFKKDLNPPELGTVEQIARKFHRMKNQEELLGRHPETPDLFTV